MGEREEREAGGFKPGARSHAAPSPLSGSARMERKGLVLLFLTGGPVTLLPGQRTCSSALSSWIRPHQEVLLCGLTPDLASVNSTADMDTVLNTTNLPSGTAWIGLYRDCRESWRWSGGEVVTFTHWRSQLPCAVLNAAGFWEERDCSEEVYFICESQGGAQQYSLIRENKTFAAAQRHCRESCSDLPLVDSVGESEQIRTTAQGHAVWIALLQDGWEWSQLEPMDDLLAQQGLLGNHTLRWREQPDGRVFCPAEVGGGESETLPPETGPAARDRTLLPKTGLAA
ncbi:C-type mannose receptor 2-like [Lepisosteus oculatus]|uniref:C-type mannose receptor 2-like n=1 Tax=Lepisosteus oculatus TaxID=7918 RepID=UPI0035F503B4